MCWELARRPEVVHQLRQELDEVMPDPRIIPTWQVLQALPYLNAFLKECEYTGKLLLSYPIFIHTSYTFMEVLRLYPSVAGPLPRVVPAQGANVMGYALPGGTTIATQPWSMHRVQDAFQDHETFRPERWLDGANDIAVTTLKLPIKFFHLIIFPRHIGWHSDTVQGSVLARSKLFSTHERE